MEVPDHVLNALVRDDASDKENIGPAVIELGGDQVIGGAVQMREIRDDRQHAGWCEPEPFQLLPVELGVTESQVDTSGIDTEFPAALEALLRQPFVHVDPEFWGRDVVVDQNLTIGNGVSDARGSGADRKVVNQDVRRVALFEEIVIVRRQPFESWIRGLNENLRCKAGLSQRALYPEHLVTNRITIAERGEDLMNLRRQFSTGPEGSSASTSAAGLRSRRRRARKPGSASMRFVKPRAFSSFRR